MKSESSLSSEFFDSIQGFLGHIELEKGLSPHTSTGYEHDLLQCATFLTKRKVAGWISVKGEDISAWIHSSPFSVVHLLSSLSVRNSITLVLFVLSLGVCCPLHTILLQGQNKTIGLSGVF